MNTIPSTTESKVKERIHVLMREWREWCGQEADRLERALDCLADQPACDLTWKMAASIFMYWLDRHYPDEWVGVSEWRDPELTPKGEVVPLEDLHLVQLGLDQLSEQ